MRNNSLEKPGIIHIDELKSSGNNRFLPFVFQFALLYLTLCGFVYCVTTSLDSGFTFGAVAACAFPCLLTAALCTLNKTVYTVFLSVFGAIFVSVVFIFGSLRDKIAESFVFCYNRTVQLVIDEGYTNYKSALTEDITEKLADTSYAEGCYRCAVIVLIIVFSVLFSALIMKRSLVWLCALPCFAVLTPSLFFGAVPSGIAFCVFLSGIVGCYVQSIAYAANNSGKKAKTVGNKNIGSFISTYAVGGLFSAIAVLVSALTVAAAVYSQDVVEITSVRDIIDKTAEKVLNRLFYEQYETAEGAIGGLLDGDVLKLNTPKFRGLPVMTVTTKTNSTLYLRGWIGTDMCDDGWLVLNDKNTEGYKAAVSDSFDEQKQLYRYQKLMHKNSSFESAVNPIDTSNFGFVYDEVKIKAKFTKSLMMFSPVSRTDAGIQGKYSSITALGDTVCFFKNSRPKSNTYTVPAALQNLGSSGFYSEFEPLKNDYLMMAGQALNLSVKPNEEEQFMIDERRYRQYVENTYLGMPDDGGYIAALSETVAGKYETDFEKALAVERYFKNNFKYARSFTTVEGTPAEKVKYMVEKSKTGYCTYFASAMTLAMRSMNIPARYVSGYHAMVVKNTGSDKYVREIKDENYHAWVEVYFDGIGWLTFDPTPGIGGDTVIRDYSYLENQPRKDDDRQTPDEPPDDDTPPDDDDGDIGNEMPIEDDSLPAWLIAIICILAAAALLGALIVLLRVLADEVYNKNRNIIAAMPPTAAVSCIYPAILSLLAAVGLTPQAGETLTGFAGRCDKKLAMSAAFSNVSPILEMSQFSDNEISDTSAARVFEYYDALCTLAFDRLNIFKKYYYKFTLNRNKQGKV